MAMNDSQRDAINNMADVAQALYHAFINLRLACPGHGKDLDEMLHWIDLVWGSLIRLQTKLEEADEGDASEMDKQSS